MPTTATGKGSEEIASEALSAGATDYLQKEPGREQYELLANRIANAVEGHRAAERAETLDRIRQLIGAVNRALVRASSREEIEREVCETISDSDPYRFAWIGEVDPKTDVVEPRAAAGVDEGYLETITVTVDDSARSRGPVGRALRNEAFAVSQNVQEDPEFEPWREQAVARGFQAVAAVPLSYGDVVYGSLAVYADRPHAFDEDEQAMLEELGDDIAHALYSLETETRYRSLFENNPIVIWEEGFSAAKRYVDDLVAELEEDEELATYLDEHPEELEAILERIEVLDVNENALEYYGATSKSELIDGLDRVVHPEAMETLRDMWVAIADGETRFRAETVGRTLQGERRHEILELHVPAAYADDYSRAYVTGTDITERKQKEIELERQYDRLEALAEVLGHDIQNQLQTATGYLELTRKHDGEAHQGYLDEIDAAHDSIESFVRHMRAFVRAGLDIAESDWVNLRREIVDPFWRECRPADGKQRLEVRDSGRVRVDDRRLEQLFENLYRNAFEHGSEDVTVRVGLLESGFYVEDDGPGIPPEEREAVLSPGYTTAAERRLGFGLTIVREIAHAHGWDVEVTESDDGGARFEFTGVDVQIDPGGEA